MAVRFNPQFRKGSGRELAWFFGKSIFGNAAADGPVNPGVLVTAKTASSTWTCVSSDGPPLAGRRMTKSRRPMPE